jgi:hypothetical protein
MRWLHSSRHLVPLEDPTAELFHLDDSDEEDKDSAADGGAVDSPNSRISERYSSRAGAMARQGTADSMTLLQVSAVSSR